MESWKGCGEAFLGLSHAGTEGLVSEGSGDLTWGRALCFFSWAWGWYREVSRGCELLVLLPWYGSGESVYKHIW